jgi:hypothetical protein
MPTVAGRLVVAVVAGLAAAWCWQEAARADAVADAWRDLASLSADVRATPTPSRLSRWLPAGWRSDDPGPRLTATADYWQRRYDDLVRRRGGDPDPEVLMAAANAAYRAARAQGGVGSDAAGRLDGVLDAYEAVLKASPGHADAAWNFEFTARARDAIARTRPGPRGRPAGAIAGLEDPPARQTVHGRPGAPPPEAKAEEFETIAPMDFGDREAQPEPTPGTRIKRKG